VGIIEGILRPRGPKLPPGEYEADIRTVFTPEGPTGPVTLKAEVHDSEGETLGVYVFETTPESSFLLDGRAIDVAVALESLGLAEHSFWVSIVATRLGELERMSIGTGASGPGPG
jgi:hypothetical protein